MSQDLGALMLNVRRHLRDQNSANYEVPDEKLLLICYRVGQRLNARYGGPDFWLTPAITLSNSGSSDFNFGSGPIAHISEVKLRSTGRLLERWPRHVIETLRESNPAPTGVPEAYYAIEGATQIMGLSFYPRPIAADFVDVNLRRFPTGSLELAPGTIVFAVGELLSAAMEYRSAAQAAAGLDQAALDRLHLNPKQIDAWLQEAASCEKSEAERRARLTRVSHIPAQVN